MASRTSASHVDGTAVELADLEGIAKDWGAVVLRGDDATARRLLEELPKADAVHVATHGFFNGPGLLQEQRQQQALLRSWEFRRGSTSLFGRGRRSPPRPGMCV